MSQWRKEILGDFKDPLQSEPGLVSYLITIKMMMMMMTMTVMMIPFGVGDAVLGYDDMYHFGTQIGGP